MRSTSLLALMMIVGLSSLNARADYRTYRGGGPTAPIIVNGPTYRTGPVYHPPVFQQPSYRPYRPVFPIYHHSAPNVYWRTGHWAHQWHDNRFGWWWVNGLGWSFYSAPVYPYPEPVETQTTIIYEPQPAPVVSAPVVATAPPPPTSPGDAAPPQGNNTYYFCESSQLYYPYARSCSERWKLVPQAPVD